MKKKYYDYTHKEVSEKFKGKDIKTIFSQIHQEQFWDEPESVSGPGSSLEQTQEIIRQLPAFLQKFKIKSMLDIPCGDLNWMKEVDLSGIRYIGGDIVPEIIESNQSRFPSSKYEFELLDLTSSKLPTVDLVFSRDCLVHFSFEDVRQAVKNMKRSGSTYLLTTTFFELEENEDIVTGDWRTLNMQKPPFNFPEPLELLVENCTELDGKYADKALGLWKL